MITTATSWAAVLREVPDLALVLIESAVQVFFSVCWLKEEFLAVIVQLCSVPDRADCRGISPHHIDVLFLRSMKAVSLGTFHAGTSSCLIFYTSSKLLLRRILQKSSFCICKVSKPTDVSYLCGHSDGCCWIMNPWQLLLFRHKGFARGRKWKGGKKANRHRLIVCETMRATFHWKQQTRHIPLFNWGPSSDPARVCNTDPEVSSTFRMFFSQWGDFYCTCCIRFIIRLFLFFSLCMNICFVIRKQNHFTVGGLLWVFYFFLCSIWCRRGSWGFWFSV